MAGQRQLAEDRAVGDPFVGLEGDSAEAEAAGLEAQPHRVVAPVDQVGHDVGRAGAVERDQQVDCRAGGSRRAGRRVLADDRAGRAGGSEDRQGRSRFQPLAAQHQLSGGDRLARQVGDRDPALAERDHGLDRGAALDEAAGAGTRLDDVT